MTVSEISKHNAELPKPVKPVFVDTDDGWYYRCTCINKYGEHPELFEYDPICRHCGRPVMWGSITEKRVMELSGLSRQALTYMRLGRPKEKGGSERYAPVLIKGIHWKKDGWFIAYSPEVWDVLRKKEE